MAKDAAYFLKDPESRIIGVREAAGILGVSEHSVRRLIAKGKLQAFKIGGSLRTSTTLCEEYVRDQVKRDAIRCRIKKDK